ncbi:increased DNA methylation 2 [Andrographis paniculata]|uniref:increased DNA methylation 2 n=1 Tax=Andrographis paniculata TaxID=175694 RepID=UPI0021E9600D|nr:increased DNA methylation 2 [Andrographis paniculata]
MMENMVDLPLSDDQCFLLSFIMGTYFGPDLERERPHKSALQRHAEGLPEYRTNNLAVSQMKTSVMESVYYYIMRKADASVRVKQDLLRPYIHGSLPVSVRWPSTYPQFEDLFPSKLHWHSRFGSQQDTIGNIVFLNNPATDFIKPGDIARFKRLTGLDDFLLDRGSAMQYALANNGILHDVRVQEKVAEQEPIQPTNVEYVNCVSCTSTCPDGNEIPDCVMPGGSSPCNAEPIAYSTQTSQVTANGDDLDQGTLYLPSCPSKDDWSNLVHSVKCGFALTGSAARGQVGPVLGLMDIGESEDSYLFRVALPGVQRDERDFSCEVESDGRVIIKGVTVTGERTVWKHSQTFQMLSHNLCPPGPFSITFTLPGPVDPQQFHGTFAADGILEGVAFKASIETT